MSFYSLVAHLFGVVFCFVLLYWIFFIWFCFLLFVFLVVLKWVCLCNPGWPKVNILLPQLPEYANKYANTWLGSPFNSYC